MPTATYNVGLTVLPVCPTWSACGRHPASTTARDAPTAARPANAAASASRTLKLADSLSPRPPETMIGASATSSVPAGAGLIRSEEHTSELQSLAYLVCRLLLEKKKRRNTSIGRRTTNSTDTLFGEASTS